MNRKICAKYCRYNGDQRRQHWQWLWQRGWQAFDGGDDGDGTKDTPAGTTTGERGMMVATGHGLCVCFGVCGETTKNKEESKKIVNVYRSALRKPPLASV